jgi:ABC-type amino acid transport substrate-binding protein
MLFLGACLALASCARQESRTLTFSSEDDLAGLRVATVAGCCYDLSLSKRNDIELLLYSFDADVLQALLNGKADVMVHDETILNSELRAEHGIKIAFKGKERFPTALVFRKDEAAIIDTLNAIQERMIQDGRMDSLKHYWLDEVYLQKKDYTHIPEEASGEPLRVACVTNMAPLSFMIGTEWYGIEVDLARELARALHRKIEFKLYDSASGMMSLKTGMADVMLGGIFITP